jgi:hypothetical protein
MSKMLHYIQSTLHRLRPLRICGCAITILCNSYSFGNSQEIINDITGFDEYYFCSEFDDIGEAYLTKSISSMNKSGNNFKLYVNNIYKNNKSILYNNYRQIAYVYLGLKDGKPILSKCLAGFPDKKVSYSAELEAMEASIGVKPPALDNLPFGASVGPQRSSFKIIRGKGAPVFIFFTDLQSSERAKVMLEALFNLDPKCCKIFLDGKIKTKSELN